MLGFYFAVYFLFKQKMFHVIYRDHFLNCVISHKFLVPWNFGYTSKSGLKNLDVELKGT